MKLKVPDAIICATAKVRKLILVTADKSLTKKIKGIKVVSPL
jgi:predicted nucleic acid-binding protein